MTCLMSCICLQKDIDIDKKRKKDKLELNKCLVVQDPFELTKNISSSASERSLGKF